MHYQGDIHPGVDILQYPGAKYRHEYPAEYTPEYTEILERSLKSGRYSAVMGMEFNRSVVFLPPSHVRWDMWAQNYVRALKVQNIYKMTAQAEFEDVARVYIYRP